MKKLLKVTALCAIMVLPLGMSTSAKPKVESNETLARCTITVKNFSAKGNCKKVLAAYREFLALRDE